MIKIFYLFLLFSIGTIAFFVYKISNVLSRNRGKKLLIKINQDDFFATNFSNELTFYYAKIELSKLNFDKKIKLLVDGTILENHTLLFIKKITKHSYLLVTQSKDIDFNITLGGVMGDVERIYQLNYRMQIDSKGEKLIIYSDLYNGNNDKSLRENFSYSLFKYLA